VQIREILNVFFLEAEEVLARVKKRGDVFRGRPCTKTKIAQGLGGTTRQFVPVDPTRKNAKTAPKQARLCSSVFIRKTQFPIHWRTGRRS